MLEKYIYEREIDSMVDTEIDKHYDMENGWTILTAETMPPPNTLVWIKRKSGPAYFGMRKDRPFSTNPDASQECHWYANASDKAFQTDVHGNWHPHNHFSDVTVEAWMPIQIPGEHGYQM